MAVSYKKLLHLMIEKDISNVELQRIVGFSGNIYINPAETQQLCVFGEHRNHLQGFLNARLMIF